MSKINREAFKKALSLLQFKSGVQADKDVGVVVHFNGGYAYTFDDERVNIVPCSLEYSGTASLKHLLAALNGKEDEIEFTWKNGKSDSDERIIKIVNGSQKIQLKGHPPDLDVLKAHGVKRLKWHPLPNGFFDCVDTLEKTVSKTVENFQLSSIHCTPEYFEAASEPQMCRFYHKLPANFDFLIRYGVLKDIPPKADKIARTQQYCYLKYDTGLVIALRIFQEPYLTSVGRYIEQERPGRIVQLPVELLEKIKTAVY